MRPGRRTDMTKLIIAFRNFANTSKKSHSDEFRNVCSSTNSPDWSNLECVGHSICLEILNRSKILLGKIKKWDTLGSPKFKKVIKVNF